MQFMRYSLATNTTSNYKDGALTHTHTQTHPLTPCLTYTLPHPHTQVTLISYAMQQAERCLQ